MMFTAAPFILYLLNAQGDVTGMTNSAGKLVISYTYDAWGRWVYYIQDTEWSNVLVGINLLLYRGYVYDHETQLYYLQSRYYDFITHRFLNADVFSATGQGLLGNNMFTYCRNIPVSRVGIAGTVDVDCLDETDDAGPDHEVAGRPNGGDYMEEITVNCFLITELLIVNMILIPKYKVNDGAQKELWSVVMEAFGIHQTITSHLLGWSEENEYWNKILLNHSG